MSSSAGSNQYQTGKLVIESEIVAMVAGVVLTILAGTAALASLGDLIRVAGQLAWVLVAAYVVAIAVQFWVSESWRNGMTVKEIILAIAWPIDVIRSLRLGLRAARGKMAMSQKVNDDTGEKVLGETAAKMFGMAVLVLATGLGFIGIVTAFSVLGSLIYLAIVVWAVGAIVQFWVAESWRDGLTTGEILLALAWPIDMYKTIRAGVRASNNGNNVA